ncbi:hypothetical protein ACU52_07120 [Xylanibacter rarus]|uniref:Uncharacterized protein n=1 Tax=Xylanibacter rarus TaxID=1676614 RepID=A0A8E1URV1_9BACT|nr:hypothetical protein ACU52_07120 [Xylanibacter rarus]
MQLFAQLEHVEEDDWPMQEEEQSDAHVPEQSAQPVKSSFLSHPTNKGGATIAAIIGNVPFAAFLKNSLRCRSSSFSFFMTNC